MTGRHSGRFISILAVLLPVFLATGACSGTVDTGPSSSGEREGPESASDPGGEEASGDRAGPSEASSLLGEWTFDETPELARLEGGGTVSVVTERPMRQMSLMFNGSPTLGVEWRPTRSGDADAGWQSVEVTWSEKGAHVGRVLLEEPVSEIEIRATERPRYLHVTASASVTARTEGPMTRDLSRASGAPRRLLHGSSGTAQTDAVVTRSEWGARAPSRLCGRSHQPSEMTIHHTANPSNDGGHPARRMRQIQAFHIDNKGWCDIGYHYVVSQSGTIYEGRRSDNRTGAHVGGHNADNVGVALIGNFEYQSVERAQFRATVEIVHSIHETFGIALHRNNLHGHTEWPGQGTSCPGANLLGRLGELVRRAKDFNPATGGSFDGAFSDDDGIPHEDAIDTLASKGVVSGCSQRKPPRFCPRQGTSRGQFVAMLDAVLEPSSTSRDFFSDDGGAYYEAAANRLAAAGILEGCGSRAHTALCPEESIARAEVAVLIDKAFANRIGSTPNNYFFDDEQHWAESAIDNLAAAGVANGCRAREFCPDETATRGQVASFLCRANGWSC